MCFYLKNFHNDQGHTFKGYSLAIMAGISASLFFIPYKMASFSIAPLPFIFIVYVFSSFFSVLYLGYSILCTRNLKGAKGGSSILGAGSWKNNLFTGGIFGVLSVIGNYSIGKSLDGSNAGLSVIVLRFQVIFVMLMGIIFLKEKLHFSFISGLLLSMIGFIMLKYQETSSILSISPFTWALVAAISFSSVQIILKVSIHKIDPLAVNLIRILSGIVFMLALPAFWVQKSAISTEHVYLALVSSFFGPFLSRNLQMFSMKHVPVSEFILFSMITPVLVLFLSWVLWNEVPHKWAIAGGFTILSGISLPIIYYVQKGKNI